MQPIKQTGETNTMSNSTTKHSTTTLDVLLALGEERMRKAPSGRSAASGTGANREARITGVVTEAHSTGLSTLQAETVLDGWTRVRHGRIVADVTPASVAAIIARRAKAAQEAARANVNHDTDYVSLFVVESDSLRPSPSAKLGGRFYIVDGLKLDTIAEDVFAAMVADCKSERDAILLTSIRPVKSAE